MKTLAVIPARAGSQRIPGKNMVDLGGKPLAQWTLEAATEAGCIDDVVVCTNDQQVKDVAAQFHVTSWEPLDHDFECGAAVDATVKTARDWIAYKPDIVVMLLPTSPFRTARHIEEALTNLENSSYSDSLISIIHCPEEITRRLRVLQKDDLVYRLRGYYGTLYFSNGAIQASRFDALLKYKSFQDGVVLRYLMDPDEGIDIDTPQDLERARQYAEKLCLT